MSTLYREDIICTIIVIYINVLEANIIPSWILIIEAWIHITLHLVKQVQIIDQLMKYITATALHKHSAVSVGMGIDSARSSLAANVAGKGNTHTPTWRLGEEGPWEGGDLLRGSVLASCRNRRTFHTRSGRPTPQGRGAQNQSHRSIIGESTIAE